MLRLLIVMCLAVAVFGIAIDPSSIPLTPLADVPPSQSYTEKMPSLPINFSPAAVQNFFSNLMSTDVNSWISKISKALGPVPHFAMKVARNVYDNTYWTLAAVTMSFIITSGVCYLTSFCTLSTPNYNVEKTLERKFDQVFAKYFVKFSPYVIPDPDQTSTNAYVDDDDQEKRSPVYDQSEY